jgi:hypothetical protein
MQNFETMLKKDRLALKAGFWAMVCMVCQDILGTLMVIAEAHYQGWTAGSMDSLQWLFSIATATIAVTALQGKNRTTKIIVVCFVTAGNLVGSEIGVLIGQRFIR